MAGMDIWNPVIAEVECLVCEWTITVRSRDIGSTIECPDCHCLSRVDYDGGEPPRTTLKPIPRPSAREVQGDLRYHEDKGC